MRIKDNDIGLVVYDIIIKNRKVGGFMESKVKAIKVGSIIAILSLIIFSIVSIFMEDEVIKNILFTIFGGTFTSAFVTIFIYVTEYGVLKKETMEEYWNASHKINQKMLEIPYLIFDEPEKLIKAYFAEISHNKLVQNFWGEQSEACVESDRNDALKICKDAESKLVEYIRPQYNHLNIEQEEIDKIIRESLKDKMQKYEERVNEVLKQYIEIADISYEDSENAYGKLYFFSNQKLRNEIYIKIHEPLRTMLRRIRIRAYGNFKPHLNKSGYNLPVMIDFINELQNEIFEIEYKCVDEEKGYYLVKSVKNRCYFKMDKEIENLRTKIYHCNPEYQDEFYSYTHYIQLYSDVDL